jgi:hypothetical protein
MYGALQHNGTYHTFDYPKSSMTTGDGINDKGDIIGSYEMGRDTSFGLEVSYK